MDDVSISKPVPILLVFGPTASGKTAIGTQLAAKFDGEVVNADSQQLYAGLPLLTALPTEAERGGFPHHLYGHVAPDQPWSTGNWLHEVTKVIAQIRSRGKCPVLVGGTGLYFEALTRGLAEIPDVEPPALERVTQLEQEQGLDAVRHKLLQVDPDAAARILGADRQRLVRALSVYEQTGQSLTSFQKNTKPVLADQEWRGIVIVPEREALYDKINLRFDQMVELGAMDELAAFCQQWSDPILPLFKAIGVRSLIKVMQDELSIEAAIAEAKRDTRRYAKRQLTWARGRTDGWQHFCDPEDILPALQGALPQ